MPDIHPTAILNGDIDLADDVVIGPFCVLTGKVTIGPGTTLIGNVYLHGPIAVGARNIVYPFVCLGFAPQHTRFNPQTPGLGLAIGDDNIFREGAVVHRAYGEDHPTTIGNHNFLMTNTHVGHDCLVGDNCTIVTGVALGGHVIMKDRVIVGGNTVVHQFCRLGEGAMLGGGIAASLDIPPWFMLTGNNICGSINLIGLRRSGAPRDMIDDVRWAHQVICRSGLALKNMIETLHERDESPIIRDYIEFIETSDRGVGAGRAKPSRGTAGAV